MRMHTGTTAHLPERSPVPEQVIPPECLRDGPVLIDPSQIRYTLWDLDGTLHDSMEVAHSIFWELGFLFEQPEVGRDDLAACFHGTLFDTICALFPGLSEDQAVACEGLFNQMQAVGSESGGVPYHDGVALAGRLAVADISQILVTNRAHEGKGQASPRSIVAGGELSSSITTIICGDEAAVRKPDPRVVTDTVRGFNGAEAVVFGDQAVDARLAYNLGATAVLVNRENSILGLGDLPAAWRAERLHVVHTFDQVEVMAGQSATSSRVP